MALLLTGVLLGGASETDWDAYDRRDDACRAKQQILIECAKEMDRCGEIALRIVTRECSPPLRKGAVPVK